MIAHLLSRLGDLRGLVPGIAKPSHKHKWDEGNRLERKIDEAIEFAIRSAQMYIGFFPGRSKFLANKRILEIGPGQDFGVPLILMGYGAQAVLVDRYLVGWDPDFHPEYYRRLLTEVSEVFPEIDLSPLKQVIKDGSHEIQGLHLVPTGLEEVRQIPSGSVQITYSNATFEHLAEGRKACLELGRVTAPGGLGFHQVDFRDHRNFDRPLEYLELPDDEFQSLLESSSYTCGNRLRYTDFEPWFKEAGFDLAFTPNLFAEKEYLEDIRLRATPRYLEMPLEALRVLGGRFLLTKL